MTSIVVEGIPQRYWIESLVHHARIAGSTVVWRRCFRRAPLSAAAWTPTTCLDIRHYSSPIRSLIPTDESHLTEPTWPTLRGIPTSVRCSRIPRTVTAAMIKIISATPTNNPAALPACESSPPLLPESPACAVDSGGAVGVIVKVLA